MPEKVHSGYRPRSGDRIELEFRLVETQERLAMARRQLVRLVGAIGDYLSALPSDKPRASARLRAEYSHARGLG